MYHLRSVTSDKEGVMEEYSRPYRAKLGKKFGECVLLPREMAHDLPRKERRAHVQARALGMSPARMAAVKA